MSVLLKSVTKMYPALPVCSGESRHSSSFTVSSHPQTDAQSGSRPRQNVSSKSSVFLVIFLVIFFHHLCILHKVLLFLHCSSKSCSARERFQDGYIHIYIYIYSFIENCRVP